MRHTTHSSKLTRERVPRARTKRSYEDFLRCSGNAGSRQERKMASIWKEMGPAVASLSFGGIEDCNWRGTSAVGGDTVENTGRRRSEDYVAVGIPIASASLAALGHAL